MNIISLFSGAGGLDIGFSQAGFETTWANEYDREIWKTYTLNFPHVRLDKRPIQDIGSAEIPDCEGIIGGPPCQSWSEAGTLKGIDDNRGKLFYQFIRVLIDKKPLFFLAENVSGMLAARHSNALSEIKKLFYQAGYDLYFAQLNAADYGIPQDRKRVFFVGFRSDIGVQFRFPSPVLTQTSLKEAIGDLVHTAIAANEKNYTNGDACLVPNHEYMIGGFSSRYMARNRVRAWDEVSFTIQAGGRHAPLHPQAPTMELVHADKRIFVKGKEHLYRRLTVRECARIQTFPDNYIFHYNNLLSGYKMVGNAVPCKLAYSLATQIRTALENAFSAQQKIAS